MLTVKNTLRKIQYKMSPKTMNTYVKQNNIPAVIQHIKHNTMPDRHSVSIAVNEEYSRMLQTLLKHNAPLDNSELFRANNFQIQSILIREITSRNMRY